MKWLWGQLSYILALMVATGIVAYQMPKRNKFILRVLLCCAAIITYKLVADVLFVQGNEGREVILINTTISFFLYILTCLSVWFCFDCNFWAALFCGTVGYCMQHISQRTCLIITMHTNIESEVLRGLLLTAITAIFYILIYFLLIKRNRYRNIVVDNRRQLLVASIVVMVTIFLHTFAMTRANDKIVRFYIILFSILIGLVGMLYEFNMMDSKNAQLEKDAVARMMNDERQHYYFEKSIIDALNIKCHDIKHYLLTLDDNKSEQAVREVKESVEEYESIINTGNAALNVVLTKKEHVCKEKNIKTTYFVDGQKLSFMAEVDIYSLFGNILDNAIEAAEKVEEEEKRCIVLALSVKDSFVFVQVLNYYCGKLNLDKTGLPQTTKDDRLFHGFGMQSIKMIVDKYGGDLCIKTEEDRFILDIMFRI